MEISNKNTKEYVLCLLILAQVTLLVFSYLFLIGGIQPTTEEDATIEDCGFDYPKPPEVNFERSWSAGEGHKYKISVDNLNDGYHLQVIKNGELSDEINENGNVTYEPDAGDRFLIKQVSDYDAQNMNLQSIEINSHT